MFTLVKIQNSGRNVPEPERISLQSTLLADYGTPVSVKAGLATLLSSTTTVLPTHLVLSGTGTKRLLAARITPDMIFETTVTAAPDSMRAGSEYTLSADGKCLTATTVSGTTRGAVLVDASQAKAAGDTVLVRFC